MPEKAFPGIPALAFFHHKGIQLGQVGNGMLTPLAWLQKSYVNIFSVYILDYQTFWHPAGLPDFLAAGYYGTGIEKNNDAGINPVPEYKVAQSRIVWTVRYLTETSNAEMLTLTLVFSMLTLSYAIS